VRGSLEQRQQGAFDPRQQEGGADGREEGAIVSELKAERVAAVGSDDAIDGRARAEEESSNLRGCAARGTKQEDVQSQQVAVAGLAELRKHLLLLGLRNVEYGRVGHSLFLRDESNV
jgi:hypothetical protein